MGPLSVDLRKRVVSAVGRRRRGMRLRCGIPHGHYKAITFVCGLRLRGVVFDRLGRSLPHLIETVTDLNTRRIGLRSLTEDIDTTTPGGRLIFHVFGALAAFERDLVKERTKAGLVAAAARGRMAGDARSSRPANLNAPAHCSPKD